MKDAQHLTSSLHQRVRLLRYALPITAFFLVVIHQAISHAWLSSTPWFPHALGQVIVYGTLGPIVVWFALSWFARWVRERDEAEAHLRCLYEISRQAAIATDMDALVAITLQMPQQVIQPVATSLIIRERPDGRWLLAGTRNLQPKEEELLGARLTVGGNELYCGQCAVLSATSHQDCPMQFPLPQADIRPRVTSVICLPLSTERPPLALLNVYLFSEDSLSPSKRRVLESMAAVLSVALDHARLRAREFQMLHRMEQATRQREGLAVILERILGDIVTAHYAQTGAIFLSSAERGAVDLDPIAAWPEKAMQPQLIPAARECLRSQGLMVSTGSHPNQHVVAIPLMAEGLASGAMVLAGQHPFTPSQQAFLRVAASMMALTIRNSQLYAELESQAVLEERNRLAREFHDGLAQSLGFLNFKMQQVDRLLAHEQGEAARRAVQEMRHGIQNLYSEVRSTIHDLRWSPGDGLAFREHLDQLVRAFSDRTGMDVSFSAEGEPNLSAQDEAHLYRILQEALANVHRHAQAKHVWVRLRAGQTGILLEVEDDGAGMPPVEYAQETARSDGYEHYGLRIMRERADAIGGRLAVQSTPGRGTQLQVSVGDPPDQLVYAASAAVASK